MHLLVFTDAGARGNPGPAAFAFLITTVGVRALNFLPHDEPKTAEQD